MAMTGTTTESITNKIASSIEQKFNIQSDPLRREALQIFQTLGLPAPKNEEYKYTPIARILEKNFSFTPSAASGPLKEVKQFFIPGLEANIIVFIDGIFSKENSSIISPEIKIQNLEEA